MDIYRDGEYFTSTCIAESEAEELGVVTPGMVLREFRAIAWPQSRLSIQPVNLRTAVNLETYFFTDNTEPRTQVVRIIGQRVEIEAAPTGYVYHFDRADSLETSDPGAAHPAGEVTHAYSYKGTATPSLDTVYTGRYRVNGGPWADIPESLTVAGTPVALEIVEVRPTLVSP